MAENKTLQILLTAKDEASKVLKGFDGALKSTGKTLQNAGAFLGKVAVGIGAVGAVAVAGAKSMVDAFAESEAQLVTANTIIKNFSEDTLKQMGGSIETATKQAGEFGAKMQALAGISDEEVTTGLIKLTQTTQNYAKAQEYATLAANLAKFKNVDYATSVDTVQKVLAGNTTVLSKMGIEMDKNATKEQVLAKLMELTRGQAEAYGQTIQGRTEILKQSLGDLQETIGQALAPLAEKLMGFATVAVKAFADVLPGMIYFGEQLFKLITTGSYFEDAVGNLPEPLQAFGQALLSATAFIRNIIIAVGDFIRKVAESETTKAVLLIIQNAFTALWGAVMQLWTALQPYVPFLQLLAQIIGVLLVGAFVAVTKVIQWFIQLLTALLNMFMTVYKFIKENLIQAIGTDIGNAVSAMGKAFEWVKGVVKNVFDGIRSFIQPIIDVVDGLISKLQAVKNMASNVTSGISNAVSGAISKVGSVFGGGKASGGNVYANRAYTVGEKGAETFIPNTNGTIIPSKAGGSGTTINITVTGNQLLDSRAGDKIGEMIIQKLKYQANLN